MKQGQVYNRADIVNFMKVGENFNRMQGFTEAGKSMNSSTYDRRYVDEKIERSDVIAYAPEIAYSFDRMAGNEVHETIVAIHNGELVGQTVEIVTVNFNEDGETEGSFKARKRTYSVIPDSEGNNNDAYTYSGAFRASGETVEGEATTTDEWATCTFA